MANSDIKTQEGLSTHVALGLLRDAIKHELESCTCQAHGASGVRAWLRDAYHHNSAHSTFRWPSAVLLLIQAICFLVVFGCGETSRPFALLVEAFFLFIVVVGNLYLVGWDNVLRHREIHRRAEVLLSNVEESLHQNTWDNCHYPHLHIPQSPCILLQWTYRNGELVNLPCSLLVKGDVIVLRPGHHAPGRCQLIGEKDKCLELNAGDLFVPISYRGSESFTTARKRNAAKSSKFIMLETPYIANLRMILHKSLCRPVTVYNKECHKVTAKYLEQMILPGVIAIIAFIVLVQSAYFKLAVIHWPESLLLRSALSVLPLIPVSLPIMWLVLHACGMAYLLAIVHLSKNFKKEVDPFEEVDEENSMLRHYVKITDIKSYFIDLLLGRKGYLWRSANLLQVFGSITALCCVDKKGVLSKPNPTADKVFFLRSPSIQDLSDNCSSFEEEDSGEEERESNGLEDSEQAPSDCSYRNSKNREHIYHPGSKVEVLDLTHDPHNAYGLQFDDPKWKNFINNLKPLGLGILLNTCNPAAQEHYGTFCDHIACESIHNDASVPVVNKRCLCELAKQIGFRNTAVDGYQLQQQLGLFRHVRPEVIQKGKLARSLNLPRLKMPFPNMECAVIKDLHTGNYQVFSQGTADLVLDACSEYWDGHDLCLLTESDRKRILDFYHRSSLTAYCMAFAYVPLNHCPDNKFSEGLIELPPDSSHLFPSLKSLDSSVRSWEYESTECQTKTHLSHHMSTDSLIMKGHQDTSNTCNIESCVQQLSNEFFIGMVTMQYQACPDFVKLVEQLEKACIRFVHFSKENELRSRVFSEKMGLESGWNCHISLLNERCRIDSGNSSCQQAMLSHVSTRPSHTSLKWRVASDVTQQVTRSQSAPSSINLEMAAVKFDDEISMYSQQPVSVSESTTSLTRDHKATPYSKRRGHTLSEMEEGNDFHDGLSIRETDPLCGIQSDNLQQVNGILIEEGNLSHSPSHITESTEQSAPITFDMSNRAKLPKGIENIRPHIENVDNVPLLVSLFTDCAPETTREMICIMQEYGEVVCCLGSAANSLNIPIFLQADVGIAVEPLYPQLCVRQPVFQVQPKQDELGPTELSRRMNSLSCPLSFHREDPVSLYHLIMEARHFMGEMRNCFQFMLCCSLSLTLAQLVTMILFLPPLLSPAHLLWLLCLVVPLLSISLLGTPLDPSIMTVATGKNLKVVDKQSLVYFFACYCAKFCPSVIIAVACFSSVISHFCYKDADNAPSTCWVFLGSRNFAMGLNSLWASHQTVGQNVAAFLLVLYFVVISVGFVHRTHSIWRQNPFSNRLWIAACFIVLLLQALFCIIDMALYTQPSILNVASEVPSYVWLVGFLWPLVLIPLNAIVKRQEIKVDVRQQKRARLEFGTKLGMNSPF